MKVFVDAKVNPEIILSHSYERIYNNNNLPEQTDKIINNVTAFETKLAPFS